MGGGKKVAADFEGERKEMPEAWGGLGKVFVPSLSRRKQAAGGKKTQGTLGEASSYHQSGGEGVLFHRVQVVNQ